MRLKPVGTVRNGITDMGGVVWEDVQSEVVVNEEYADALDRLEEFSHILVLFWMDRAKAPDALKVHPMRRDDLPLVGFFATRSPARPNPIGVTAVRLLERRGNRLIVLGLDALDGTPVLDIKPYIHYGDAVKESHVSGWVRRFNEELLSSEAG